MQNRMGLTRTNLCISSFRQFYLRLRDKINVGDTRTILARKNIIGSFANKGLSIFINLALVPITIGYLDTFMYGLWLTLSSIVAWVSYFDMGLGHGFKNKMAEAIAHEDVTLIKQYVSTTYITFAIIFSLVIIGASISNLYLDWSSILNISQTYGSIVRNTVSVIIITMGVSQVLNIINNILIAYQRSALAAFLTTVGQLIALIVILILTMLPNKSIVYISLAFTCAPIIVSLIASIYLFNTRFSNIRPSFNQIKFRLIGDILGLGGKFFVIQLSMLIIFQMVNFILTRVLGPEAVTQYNVAYKYFSILQMIFMIILSPYWVAFTDAYTKRDFAWLEKTSRQIHRVFLSVVCIEMLLLVFAPIGFKIWVGDKVMIGWGLSVAMAVYIVTLSYSNMYMIFINGIGKVFLQSLIYLVFALISIPISIYACRHLGLVGILMVLSSVYLVQAIVAKIQIKKLISQTARGIWNK